MTTLSQLQGKFIRLGGLFLLFMMMGCPRELSLGGPEDGGYEDAGPGADGGAIDAGSMPNDAGTTESPLLDVPLLSPENGLHSIGVTRSRGMAPSIAFDGARYFAVWFEPTNGFLEPAILGARVSTDGELLDRPATLIAADVDPDSTPRVAAGPAGFVVTWHQGGVSRWVRVRSSDGALLDASPRTVPFDGSVHEQTYPCVASNGNDYLLVWQERLVVESETVVKGLLLDESAQAASAPLTISDHPEVTFGPTLATDGEHYIVAWQQGAESPVIATRRMTTSEGLEADAAPSVLGQGRFPSIASNGSSFLLVAQRQTGADSSTIRPWLWPLDVNGQATGDANELVTASPDRGLLYPRVFHASGSDYVVLSHEFGAHQPTSPPINVSASTIVISTVTPGGQSTAESLLRARNGMSCMLHAPLQGPYSPHTGRGYCGAFAAGEQASLVLAVDERTGGLALRELAEPLGERTPLEVINAAQSGPAVARGESQFFVAWTVSVYDQTTQEYFKRVMGTLVDADSGERITTEPLELFDRGNCGDVRVAHALGEFAIVARCGDGDLTYEPTSIVLRRFDELSGELIDSEPTVIVDARAAPGYELAFHEGSLAVLWTERLDSASRDLLLTEVGSDWVVSEPRRIRTSSDAEPRMGNLVASDGLLLAVWSERTTDGTDSLWARDLLDASAAETLLYSAQSSIQQLHAARADGTTLLQWTEASGTDFSDRDLDMKQAVLDPSSTELVSMPTTVLSGLGRQESLALSSDGRYFLAVYATGGASVAELVSVTEEVPRRPAEIHEQRVNLRLAPRSAGVFFAVYTSASQVVGRFIAYRAAPGLF